MLTNGWEDKVKPSFFQQFITQGTIPEVLPSFSLHPDYANRVQVFNNYLHYGGYPAITHNTLSNEERFDWLLNYVRTYLERDIRDLADFRNLEPFVRVQKMTSLLTGALINYVDLAKEAGISPKTAQRFLYYLEVSYQTLLLQPWYKNKLKRLSKSLKLHYLDPGVQRAILQKRGETAGNEFESAVIAEIYKQAKNSRFNLSFYHLRTLDGREVDLLLETEHGYIAIEIKMTRHVNRSDARHLTGLSDILNKPLLKSFVLSMDNSVVSLDKDIVAMPAAMFLT